MAVTWYNNSTSNGLSFARGRRKYNIMGRKPKTTTTTTDANGTPLTPIADAVPIILTERQKANQEKKAELEAAHAKLQATAKNLLPFVYFSYIAENSDRKRAFLQVTNPNDHDDTQIAMLGIHKLNPELAEILVKMDEEKTAKLEKDKETLATLLRGNKELTEEALRLLKSDAIQGSLEMQPDPDQGTAEPAPTHDEFGHFSEGTNERTEL